MRTRAITTWRNNVSTSNQTLDEIFKIAADETKTPEERIRTVLVMSADQSNPEHMQRLDRGISAQKANLL